MRGSCPPTSPQLGELNPSSSPPWRTYRRLIITALAVRHSDGRAEVRCVLYIARSREFAAIRPLQVRDCAPRASVATPAVTACMRKLLAFSTLCSKTRWQTTTLGRSTSTIFPLFGRYLNTALIGKCLLSTRLFGIICFLRLHNTAFGCPNGATQWIGNRISRRIMVLDRHDLHLAPLSTVCA